MLLPTKTFPSNAMNTCGCKWIANLLKGELQMQSTLEVTVVDDQWPKLRIVCQRRSTTGEPVMTNQAVLYDQAAVQFENQLINHLRVMVQDVVNRHKGQVPQSPQR